MSGSEFSRAGARIDAREAERYARKLLRSAADVCLSESIASGREISFVELEDEKTGQARGAVVVCLTPELVEDLLEFVANLGNSSTRVVESEDLEDERDPEPTA